MSSDRRLHPASVLVDVVGSGGLLVALLALIATRRWTTMALTIGYAGITAIAATLRYLRTAYRLDELELVVRDGLWSRRVRHIRYDRIQNLDVRQHLVQRWLGVAEVRVETGGGTEPEALLSCLALADAEAMREHVLARRSAATLPPAAMGSTPGAVVATQAPGQATLPVVNPTPARVLVRLSWRDLLVVGLGENRVGLVFATLAGLAYEARQLGLLRGSSLDATDLVLVRAIRAIRSGDWSDLTFLWPLLAGLFAFVLVLRGLSVVWTLLRLHGFTLTTSADQVCMRYGLLTTVNAIVPRHRIQLVTVTESPLHRAFGAVAVQAETAGGGGEADGGHRWLAPLLPKHRLPELLADILPGLEWNALAWHPAHARARQRGFRSTCAWLVPALLLLSPWARLGTLPLAAASLALAWWIRGRQALGLAHALGPGHVAHRGGAWWRHASVAPTDRVQVVAERTSRLDRRWGMASLTADTAGGGKHPLEFAHLAEGDASALRQALASRAAATPFRW